MVNGMEAKRWSTMELADGSDLDVKRRFHTENSRVVPVWNSRDGSLPGINR